MTRHTTNETITDLNEAFDDLIIQSEEYRTERRKLINNMKLKLNKEQIEEINATRDMLHSLNVAIDNAVNLLRGSVTPMTGNPDIDNKRNYNAFNAIMEFVYDDDSDIALATSFDEYVDKYEHASDFIETDMSISEISTEPNTDVLQQTLCALNTHGHTFPKPFTVEEFVEVVLPNVVLDSIDIQTLEERIMPAFKDALIYISENYVIVSNCTLKYLPNPDLFEYTK